MRYTIQPLVLLILVAFEGVALEILPSGLIDGNLMITPHWVLMFLLLIAIFYDRKNSYYAIIYAIIFGLLIDIAYTGILGVYMFTYGVVIYIIHELKNLLHSNIYSTLLFGIISITIADLIIFLIYYVVGITDTIWMDYLMERLLPSILANTIFLSVLYPIFAKRFDKWKNSKIK